ncbi:MAG TPA: hypothetical protein VMV69_09160 [Pirellulales bacterium]|nr:hypothetical protein [Pirellulales bacterium]
MRINADAWVDTVERFGRMFHRGVGRVLSMAPLDLTILPTLSSALPSTQKDGCLLPLWAVGIDPLYSGHPLNATKAKAAQRRGTIVPARLETSRRLQIKAIVAKIYRDCVSRQESECEITNFTAAADREVVMHELAKGKRFEHTGS